MVRSPEVRPATMRRWKINTTMMMGMVTTIAAAAIAPVGWENCEEPVKKFSAAGTVRLWSVDVSVIAKTKSFQQKQQTRLTEEKTNGAARGTMTFRKAW